MEANADNNKNLEQLDIIDVREDTAEEIVEIETAEVPQQIKINDKAPHKTAKAAVPYAVVGGGETDDVLLSRCVYKSRVTRKSLTVHHLQRRLLELGHIDAGTDKDGWYGDHTFRAVKEFQERSGLPATGLVDADTLHAVFKGDPNVTVVIDA